MRISVIKTFYSLRFSTIGACRAQRARCKLKLRPLSSAIAFAVASSLLLWLITACTPLVSAPGEPIVIHHLTNDDFLAKDNVRLPYRSWMPVSSQPKAIVIALHGFNDYSRFFEQPAHFLSAHNIGSYAYDQRGFGNTPNRGLWAGVEAYIDDLAEFTELVRKRHPGIPVHLLGESMGGAVIMVAMNSNNPPDADSIILCAPAVWGRSTMPWYQRVILFVGSHTVPWVTLTGRGLNIRPSDNIEMLRALGRDPMVIKETRIDAMYGLTNLMDAALVGSSNLTAPALFMYGEKDEVIPKYPTQLMLDNLPKRYKDRQRIAIYKNGYHMLLRDLEAKILWQDIATWVRNPRQSLPSMVDIGSSSVLGRMSTG